MRSYEVGALPLINAFLERMRLSEILTEHLPADDPRTELSTVRALMVLVRNVLLARQPVYGVAEWAARFAPDLLNLWPVEVSRLHDDRLGRSLHRLFLGVGPQLIMAVVRHIVQEFAVSLDELHNDSTTVSFYGAYEDAQQEGNQQGRPTHAITWGHSKDHRPDLKQLLYILTVSEDGGVPVYFTSASGNVADDCTHCATWDLLHELVGRPEFLYVADCKLASSDNLSHIATRGGRFVTVMPRTYKEDEVFRDRLRKASPSVTWRPLYDVKNAQGELCDRFCVCTDEMVTSDGYRLLWFHSRRKADLDAVTRNRRIQRALALLADLRARLIGPRTRYRQRAKVEQAVARILEEQEVTSFVVVRIAERSEVTYSQAGPGRPTQKTRYVKATKPGYTLSWELDSVALSEAERDDGVFPLLTNDRSFDAEQVLRAYKRQPLIEKRFSQMKTDFAVAPVYLQNVARIQGLLAVYFFVLMTQTLMERELRRAMANAKVPSLPLYPEGRPCTRPTMYRIFELFEPIQRHEVRCVDAERKHSNRKTSDEEDTRVMVTTLTPVHRQLLKLLGLSATDYGR
ncbi:MAG: IS1634 family transposase [Planctomycetales bacterium]